MDQDPLFFDSVEDAARHVIQVLGGMKQVASAMRPAKSPEQAARWLADCLNQDRAEHLQLADLIWLAREARKHSCHALMAYVANEAGYATPAPIAPQDEQAALMRQFVLAAKTIDRILPRIEASMNAHEAIRPAIWRGTHAK